MRSSLPILSILFALAGCGGAPGQPSTPATPSIPPAPASVPSSAPTTAAPAAKPTTPADPVRAAAQKALTSCKWEEGEPDWDCADAKAFDDLAPVREGKADATLVAMLGDADVRLVWLAGKALDAHGEAYRTDKALAEKVVARLETSLPARHLTLVAEIAGAVDVAKTGLGARMLASSEKLPVDARAAFVRAAQFRNSDFFYASTAALAKDSKDEPLREAAIRAFWVGTPSGKGAEVCELWTSIAEDGKTSDALASLSADFAAWTPMDPCTKEFDRLLARLDKRAKAGPLDGWDWPHVAEHLAGNRAASPAQQKKAVGWLKAAAENPKNKPNARSAAARGLIAVEIPTAKGVLAKFAKDKDGELQKIAASLEPELKDAEKRAEEKKKADAGKQPDAKQPAGAKGAPKKPASAKSK
jgi:hypothetical protein